MVACARRQHQRRERSKEAKAALASAELAAKQAEMERLDAEIDRIDRELMAKAQGLAEEIKQRTEDMRSLAQKAVNLDDAVKVAR